MSRPNIQVKLASTDTEKGWAVVRIELRKGGWHEKVLLKGISLTAARQIAAILKEDG